MKTKGEGTLIGFGSIDWTDNVPGIRAREAEVEGQRWAIVVYAPKARREEWCPDGHAGFVLAGAVEYEFQDGAQPLMAREGEAFRLATGHAHRGVNRAPGATRLFLMDDRVEQLTLA